MDIIYQYGKIRSNYGRQPMFCEFGPELCDTIPVNVLEHKQYILRNPVHSAVQHGPIFSQQEINTIRAEYTTTGINHAEGGWPKDVIVTDPESTQRYRRKTEKDDGYIHCVMSTAPALEGLILQNNAIDMYQIYYNEMPRLPDVERMSCRTVNVYRDGGDAPSAPHRPVSSICWRPDGNIFAVTYLDMDINRNVRAPINASIWDIENANAPIAVLTPDNALLDLQFNPRHSDIIAGGMLSGQVAVWDRRTASPAASITCPPHVAHRDYVRHVRFINAKTGMEFFSGGPDGACKWWDIRNMSEYTDQMIIQVCSSSNEQPTMAKALGISCLEFEPTIPTRFMVGTENGIVASGNRKGKTSTEKIPFQYETHLGPVRTLERNPGFLKNFLTVGDWTARVWSEECRESAVIWSPPHRHKITHGAWSPTRLSLIMLVQANGVLALWDILRRQYEPVLTVQVCEEPLVQIKPHDLGSLIACGSVKGNIYMMEVSNSLAQSARHDKGLMTAMFEREAKREKILEARLREIRLKLRTGEEGEPLVAVTSLLDTTIGDKDLHEATAEYFTIAKKEIASM
ncbi:unnamed protein product [Arctia plantaginis]|uniref:Dynein intermediate chain 2, axonemal n=1 Tax=Arctia plantaginis TaxID=874455 RepID=A0A8S0ZFG3_ARCPL|nr:unnamed protein product [Arctia plantaginis]